MRISDWSSDVCSSDLLSAAEAFGEDAVLDAAEQFGGIVVAAAHEGVGHPRHRRMRETFAAAVAGGFDPHQPRIEAILHIALEDAVLDQHGLARRGPFVVDRKRAAAAAADGAVHRAIVAKIGKESCRERGCQYR